MHLLSGESLVETTMAEPGLAGISCAAWAPDGAVLAVTGQRGPARSGSPGSSVAAGAAVFPAELGGRSAAVHFLDTAGFGPCYLLFKA